MAAKAGPRSERKRFAKASLAFMLLLIGATSFLGQSQPSQQAAGQAKPVPATPKPAATTDLKGADGKSLAGGSSEVANPVAAGDAPKLSPEKQRSRDQLAQDTARLYALANELKTEMDKSTKDTLSLNVIRKADEVEKMAKKVRAEMKANFDN